MGNLANKLRCVLANRTLGFHPRSRGFDSRPEYCWPTSSAMTV